jgi:hypothetical protein
MIRFRIAVSETLQVFGEPVTAKKNYENILFCILKPRHRDTYRTPT